MSELMRSGPVSSEVSDVAIEISDALGESLFTIRDQYFGDSDKINRDLVEERDCLRENLRAREEWDLAHLCECSREHLYYREDVMLE
jgi:hypothetical protein